MSQHQPHWMSTTTLGHARCQLQDAGYTNITMTPMDEPVCVVVRAVDTYGDVRQCRITRAADIENLQALLKRASSIIGAAE